MFISVIIPAHNEEKYLGDTLRHLQRAKEVLLNKKNVPTEIIVVDNDSTDSTADVALGFGARIVKETVRNVAKVRNAGARFANGNVLVFLDADTSVPDQFLHRISKVMANPICFGGAFDTDYRPSKLLVKAYLQVWRILGRLAGMAQGAAQFSRSDVYAALRGYDELLYMGEDVDFHWRMGRLAKRQGAHVHLIEDICVVPSTRRFDQWSLCRTLICTNPLYVFALRRKNWAWRGWYRTVPR